MKVRNRTIKPYVPKTYKIKLSAISKYEKANSKKRVKYSTKRLKKKLHLGEYTQYVCVITYDVKDTVAFEEEVNTDAFVDYVIDVYEENDLCGTYYFDGKTFAIMVEHHDSNDIEDLKRQVEVFKGKFANAQLTYKCEEYLDAFYGNFD